MEDETKKTCNKTEKAFNKFYDCGLPATHYYEPMGWYLCADHAMLAIIAGWKLRNIYKPEDIIKDYYRIEGGSG